MSDHEVRAFYDHEIEDGSATGGRRRPVADWGVGEELFDRMPSRRRFRPSEGPARRDNHAGELAHRDAHPTDAPRRDVHPRERRFVSPAAETAEFELPREQAAAAAEPVAPRPEAPRPEAPRREPARREAPAGLVAPADARPEPPAEPSAPPEAPARAEIDTLDRPGAGRRTVVIRGRGAEPATTPRRARPPRTVGERLGPRPDRVAAWAVALGVLLILIAILTAH
jgi:hypothetical protein